MDVQAFLQGIATDPRFDGQLVHVEELPERAARYAAPARPLPTLLEELLERSGMPGLYVHQARALDLAREGRDLVVVTGTASGKTLCYNLPILERCLDDRQARALYLYPTKALAQDQLKGQRELLGAMPEVAGRIRHGVYDGDTPTAERRRLRAEAQLVLSNPDMLHAAILPYHPKWSRFFGQLQFVVLDEVHTYRGILGAHVACVLRRLLRICEHYGSQPVFLAASATIANPAELTTRLVGRPVALVDDDGSPRGRKYFAFWNPSGGDEHARWASSTDDAVWLMSEAVQAGAQTLAFTRTRQAAELVQRYVQQTLERTAPRLAAQVGAYRGGYLPQERRQIEQDLFQGRLRAVSATNALELGIDIGSLDVALLVNYPGTIASTWQQAGRSGRRSAESLAVLLAGNDPVDQYLLRHPQYFFAQSPEHAVVDPENPYVLSKHLQAAAFELPLRAEDCRVFGDLAAEIALLLHEEQALTRIDDTYYHGAGQNPAQAISLRHMSDHTFSIVLQTAARDGRAAGHEVMANVDAISAPELVYPQAIYLHHGETYLVRELDWQGKVAYVERKETDYYTQAVLESSVTITQTVEERSPPSLRLARGKVDVSWKTVAFKKIKFGTRENIGFGSVDLPAQSLPTTAIWLVPDIAVRQALQQAGFRVAEGLCGLRNLAVMALPMLAMCDSRDISGVVDSKNLGHSTMILYDRYPGGLGYCEQGFDSLPDLLQICREMVVECPCEDGCPSCVGLPNLRPAIHSDPDLTRGYPIPNKAATVKLLELL